MKTSMVAGGKIWDLTSSTVSRSGNRERLGGREAEMQKGSRY